MDATATRNGRSEVEIIGRSGIPVEMGGATYRLRPLSMDAADQWEVQIRDVIAGMFGRLGEAAGGVDSLLGLYRATVSAQLDALYAYDDLGHDEGDPGVLPTRDTLRRVASRDDVDEAIRKLVKHEFPLLKGMDFLNTWVPDEVRQIVARQLIRLIPEPSAPVPSTSDSSTSTPRTATRRRSGRH